MDERQLFGPEFDEYEAAMAAVSQRRTDIIEAFSKGNFCENQDPRRFVVLAAVWEAMAAAYHAGRLSVGPCPEEP